MTAFLAARWSPEDDRAERDMARIRTVMARLAVPWCLTCDEPGWMVAEPHASMTTRSIGEWQGVLLGQVFGRDSQNCPLGSSVAGVERAGQFEGFCRSLVRDVWGAYVAIWVDLEAPDRLSIMRDPMGMIDCATWTCGGLRLVSSHPDLWLSSAPPRGLAIDWERVSDLLVFPATVRSHSPLIGVETIPPGAFVRFSGERFDISRLWSAADHCATRKRVSGDPAALRGITEVCVAAWLRQPGPIVAEISGGLDSAIVAASARESGAIDAGFHFSTTDPRGDERRYARSVGVHLGFPVVEVDRPMAPLTVDDLMTMPIGFRPGLGSTSLFHDRELAARLSAYGARTLITGHGGDAVYFQPPAVEIAAEPCNLSVRDRLTMMMSLAGWADVPVWTVLGQALFGRFHPSAGAAQSNGLDFLHRDAPIPRYRNDWHGDMRGLPRAKQIHLQGIANSQSAFGTSWCSQVVDVFHPLMSQPLVEHVLGVPVVELTRGRRDRFLARQAFGDLLPRDVVTRERKGGLTFHFGRVLAASLDLLRPYLLDGELAARGIIDRDKLDSILDTDHLMHADHNPQLFATILVEQWVRTWLARIASVGPRASTTIRDAAVPASSAGDPATRTRARKGRAHSVGC